jgi:Putative ParB-like nuclease
MRNAMSAGASVLLILFSIEPPALARDPVCDAQPQKGEFCLCAISALHPTQSSVGMAEVKIKVEKLKPRHQRARAPDDHDPLCRKRRRLLFLMLAQLRKKIGL